MTEWLPAHDAMLRDNFDKGLPLSYAEMAEVLNNKFGTDFTRNAAIGRGHRLGLTQIRPRTVPKTGPKRAVTPAQRPDVARRKAASAPKPDHVPFVPRPDPRPGQVPLLDLADDGCRYPNGDSVPYLFCDAPKYHPELPYCANHAALCYRAPEPRRRPS